LKKSRRDSKAKLSKKRHRSAKHLKRAAEEEENQRLSIQKLVEAEEHRLLEHKRRRKDDSLKREILEHATSLEFELQQLIILLRRTPRQMMLMRQAQAAQNAQLAQLESTASAELAASAAATATSTSDAEEIAMPFTPSELGTRLRRLSSAVILSQLILQDLNGWFFRPVSDLVANYAAAIYPALPSDFGTVWCRLVQKGYDDLPDQFAEDLRKIWRNCQLFNGKNAQVSLEAMRLSSYFETNWAWLRGSSENTPASPLQSDAHSSVFAVKENDGLGVGDAASLSSGGVLSLPSSSSSSSSVSFSSTSLALSSSPALPKAAQDGIMATPGQITVVPEASANADQRSRRSEGTQADAEAASSGPAPVSKVSTAPPEKLWCQCDDCERWHEVPPTIDLDSLPEQWYCSMNTWNPTEARCNLKKSPGQNPEVASSSREPQALFGLKKSLGLGLAEEPHVFLERGEWLAYAREIGRFASVSKKLTLPKRFLKGIESLYVEVGGELAESGRGTSEK
jgi:hypothetical protein